MFTALGAARIVATSNRAEQGGRSLRVKALSSGLHIRHGKGSSSSVEVDQRGTGGTAIDPRPLRYPEEPGLEAACEAVLRLGAQHCTIKIEQTSQYGVDGELGIRLRKAGFGLGASAARTQTSVFTIDAVFGQGSASTLDPVVDAATEDQARAPRRLFRKKQA